MIMSSGNSGNTGRFTGICNGPNSNHNDTVPNGIDVCVGNHDRMAARKSMTGGIPSAWIRSYNEVLNTPDWNWVENVIYNDLIVNKVY